MNRRSQWAGVILGMFTSITTLAAPIEFQNSERQVSLVELYTSEGCSSCPPADSWLSRLKAKPGLWNEFVPIGFHVDYWDHLGWHDKWAQKQFSDRQRAYAAAASSDNVYTPEYFLNGKEWQNRLSLRGAPGLSENQVGVLKVTSEDTNHWQVSFMPKMGGATAYEVNAALLVCGLNSDVNAGENTGRHLQHDFAALKLINQPLTDENGAFHGVFTMTAADENSSGGRLALAVWVSRHGSMEPVQALGGWLAPSEKNK